MPRGFALRHTSLALALHLGLGLGAVTIPTTVHAQSTAIRSFDIPAGGLDQVLNRFALEADIELYLDAALTNGLQSTGLQGRFSVDQGLDTLLANSGLRAQRQADDAWRLYRPQTDASTIQLAPLNVQGTALYRPSRDEAGYDAIYDENISSVYSGKQQIERYKGTNPADVFKGMLNVYTGDARNSGALDPNIRGIQGPGRVPLTIDGTEQAMSVWRGYNGASNRSYIDPNLIGGIKVIKGPNIERNVNSSVGGAVVASTIDVDDILAAGDSFGGEFKLEAGNNTTSPRIPKLRSGENYYDVPGFPMNPSVPSSDPTLRINLKSSSDDKVLSTNDHAYRLALGTRQEKFELLGAYAFREHGNYFSGKNGAGYYSQEDTGSRVQEYSQTMALDFHPGDEVPNTSSKMESWLFKARWKFDDNHNLTFGYRDTDSLYGEILPTRLANADEKGAVQWPLSHVDAKAYNMEYQYNPDNRWIDLYANLWTTRTESDTYSAGGFPNYATWTDPVLRNTAVANADQNRTGLTLSNQLQLASSLDLTLGGSYQHEKLRSGDEYGGVDDGWRMFPRAGRREEREFNFNFDWRPTDFLTLDLGMRYSSFWAKDDFLAEQQAAGNLISTNAITSRNATYRTTESYTEEEMTTRREDTANVLRDTWGFSEEQIAEAIANLSTTYTATHRVDWLPDSKGRYSRDTNACLNGTLDSVDNLTGDCTIGTGTTSAIATPAKTRHGHGWTPVASAALRVTDNSRVYLRYSEALRYPSMFESTIGFSASLNPFYTLEPEHAFNYEVGYVHNLTELLNPERFADIKLAYYQHRTKNLIERSNNFMFYNIEQQTLRGIELQTRYDNGGFFGDLSLAYNLENEVCDKNSAVLADPRFGSVPDCVENGFMGGYLIAHAIPRYSVNLNIGGRLFNDKLELGSRATYFSKHENSDLDDYKANAETNLLAIYNLPLSWGSVTTYDAYVSYQPRDDLTLELVGSNLTDEYYIDPTSRSAVAAPGRALKLSLTAQF
ncbi:TonB-dependent receptor [Halopseudomonas pelagia]|uniref:TonB-dependent receptor n=1 Tax=Halopseudomonas pelagia TaxID=553151 RepID=UPI0030DC3FB6|tara:strand:+ start:7222 stop:10245 length:3024 start_codon:yes stop_codon:yes gene_type:complete